MTDRRTRLNRIAVAVALFALLPGVALSNYWLRIITLVAAFALFAISLNVVFGHTDQLFLVVGGLGGVSGYTAASVAAQLGVTPWLTLPLGVALAGVLGAAVSYVAAKQRFSVILIAIFTLALQLALNQFFLGARSITGGSDGLLVGDLLIDGRLAFYYVFVAALLVYLLGYDWLVNSRYGVAFEAIREDDLAAASIGVDVVRYKTFAGLLGAVMIGLAGALYGFAPPSRLFPAIYSFASVDVLVLIMLTIGGMRTTFGPIVGAVLIYAIDALLSLADVGGWRTFVFGILLIVLFLYFREGIVPKAVDALEARGIELPGPLRESS